MTISELNICFPALSVGAVWVLPSLKSGDLRIPKHVLVNCETVVQHGKFYTRDSCHKVLPAAVLSNEISLWLQLSVKTTVGLSPHSYQDMTSKLQVAIPTLKTGAVTEYILQNFLVLV